MHTHFVATVIYRRKEGRVEFLVIDYRSTNPRSGQRTAVQTKFVGGTNKECPHESVADTRDREVLEESGLTLLNSKLIWKKEASTDHTKYGFLCEFSDCSGELRQEVMTDDGDKLSPPYWFPSLELARMLYTSHQAMYMAALNELGIY